MDCTHVSWGRCPAQQHSAYSGEEKKPTVAYEVTVDHTRKILYVSIGHPGSRNDKTIVKTDEFPPHFCSDGDGTQDDGIQDGYYTALTTWNERSG